SDRSRDARGTGRKNRIGQPSPIPNDVNKVAANSPYEGKTSHTVKPRSGYAWFKTFKPLKMAEKQSGAVEHLERFDQLQLLDAHCPPSMKLAPRWLAP